MAQEKACRGTLDRRTLLKSLAVAGMAAPFVRSPAFAQKSTIAIDAISLSANSNRIFDEVLAGQGFLQEFGVAPKTTAVADGSKVIAALVGGADDVCMQIGFASVIPAIQAGAKIKIIAGSGMIPEIAFYSAKPDVQTIADLVGRSVAVGPLGAHLHMLMVTMMRKKGIDYTKVNFVNIGGAADAFRAAASGRVDAGPGELAFYGNPAKYGVHALKDGATWLEIPEYLNQVSIATDAAIEQRGEGILRMLAAYRRLYQFLHSPKSSEPWLKAVQKVLNITGTEEAEAQSSHYQKYKPFAEGLLIPADRLRYMQDLNMLLGTQKSIMDTNLIVNTSLAQKALAMAA